MTAGAMRGRGPATARSRRLRPAFAWATLRRSEVGELNVKPRICLLLSLIAPAALGAATPCQDLESVDERMSCLQEQYCADAETDAERAQCYEDIVRRLLTPATVEAQPPAPPANAAPTGEKVAPKTEQATVQETEPPAPAATPAPAGEKAAASKSEQATVQSEDVPVDAFGRRPEPVYSVEEPKRISAKISSVVEQRDGRLLVGLDNGQVWEENEVPTRMRKIKLGSSVEISKVTFGYILRFKRWGSTRVTRIPCNSAHATQIELSKCQRAGYADGS